MQMQTYVIILIVFGSLFSFFGIFNLISFFIYIIPQCLPRIFGIKDLKKRYNGGWVFITGGNSGIGEAFAKKIAKQGFNIVILG
jgi:hypothetical protein